MKINIVTFYWSNNLGALIQAYSLKKFIEIETKKNVRFNTYQPKKLIIRERQSQLNKKNLKIIHKVFLKKIKLFHWKKKFLKCNLPSNKSLDFKDDLYIYGSDEIWNYQNPFFGFDPHFFGKDNKKQKISYAVSVGSSNIYNQKNKENLKSYLKTFKNISVRDLITQKFVKYLIGTTPQILLDPCFLIDAEKIINKKNNIFHLKKYILIYGDYFNKKEISEIVNFSKLNNLQICSFGFYNYWADENIISIDPVDLIYSVINSSLVITSMFHGIMLSYKYRKNFWYSIDPYRINKLSHFIDNFDLKNRYLDKLNNDKVDYKNYENKILDLTHQSKNFIKENINT
jgi:hypothetical protein